MGVIRIDEAGWMDGRGYRKNRLADEAALACPGALVQMVTIAPGEMVPDHVHQTSTEFYYVVRGHCRLVVNEASHWLQPGDMFLTRPGDLHRLYNEGEATFTLLVFKTNATAQDTYWTDR